MQHFYAICFVILAATPSTYASEPESSKDLAKRIAELDAGVIVRGKTTRPPMAAMLSRYVDAELRSANQRDRRDWSKVKTKVDWQRLSDKRMQALRKSLGQFPKVPKTIEVFVTRTTKGDGFEVDNIVFESRPGVVVAANLYRPARPAPSMPAIIICNSHLRPKNTGARQLMAATWARAGCIVYAPDHIGHGERRQHPFGKESDYDRPFRLSSQDYYFRYDSGIQLHLIGDCLMGWLAWDLSRGVDVLLQNPRVDPKRILVISEPAGGGDVAAVTTALDSRIAGVMVNNFGGPEPENGYPLPPDADSWFPYASSGSWESTRNLRLSARDGFVPWAITAGVAPRRLIYYHEFYWDRQQDPIWKRLRRVFGFYNQSDNLVGLAGHGFVVGPGPQNTHWIPYSRELLYPTLNRWFGIHSPNKEFDKLLPEDDLLCLSSEAVKKYNPVPLHRLCSQLGAERTSRIRTRLRGLTGAERRSALREGWRKLLGDIDVKENFIVRKRDSEKLGGVSVERIQLGTEPGIVVPILFLIPKEKPGPFPVVIGVAQAGKHGFFRNRSTQIAELLHDGKAVCLLDVRGTGETAPGNQRGRRSESTTLSSSELMLGQTLVGARLRDLRQVLRYVRERADVQPKRISVWGESFAPVNAADLNFAVPRGIADRPHQSEPLGGILALLAALFDEEIEAVYVHGGLSGFHDILQSPFCYVPHDIVVPGVLTIGDLCDVAAAIAPRPLLLDGLVDGLNRRLSAKQIRSAYGTAVESFRRAGALERFTVTDGGSSILGWLRGNRSTK